MGFGFCLSRPFPRAAADAAGSFAAVCPEVARGGGAASVGDEAGASAVGAAGGGAGGWVVGGEGGGAVGSGVGVGAGAGGRRRTAEGGGAWRLTSRADDAGSRGRVTPPGAVTPSREGWAGAASTVRGFSERGSAAGAADGPPPSWTISPGNTTNEKTASASASAPSATRNRSSERIDATTAGRSSPRATARSSSRSAASCAGLGAAADARFSWTIASSFRPSRASASARARWRSYATSSVAGSPSARRRRARRLRANSSFEISSRAAAARSLVGLDTASPLSRRAAIRLSIPDGGRSRTPQDHRNLPVLSARGRPDGRYHLNSSLRNQALRCRPARCLVL